LPSGDYTFLHTDNIVVCQIKTSRTAIADEEDEEGVEGEEGAGDVPATETDDVAAVKE